MSKKGFLAQKKTKHDRTPSLKKTLRKEYIYSYWMKKKYMHEYINNIAFASKKKKTTLAQLKSRNDQCHTH